MKKIQITVDEDTVRLLDELATPRAGNKSFVVREAVKRMAEQDGFEQYLDWLESQPQVRSSMERALADEQARGRVDDMPDQLLGGLLVRPAQSTYGVCAHRLVLSGFSAGCNHPPPGGCIK